MLVQPEWLIENLGGTSLRIVDATVLLNFDPESGETTVQSGRAHWTKGHILGSTFADLVEITPPDRALPQPENFARAMSELGIGNSNHVVVYDYGMGMWATRLWWMLRVFGHGSVSVLDGGWKAWNDAGYPASTEPPVYSATHFEARFRPELVASTAEVESHVAEGQVCLINALSPEMFRGEQVIGYRRPGRIPGSINVPYYSLLDPNTNRFLDIDRLQEHFDRAGVPEKGPIVTYCGGGIAATMDAFGLALLGRKDVAVYNGSLTEWTADQRRPVETGPVTEES